MVYYFPNGTRSAYEFTVLVKGKSDGFILVAAQRYMPPVLEFGKGESPSERLGRIGTARIKGFSTERHRLLYYDGLSCSVELDNGEAIDIYGRQVPVPKTIKLALSPRQVMSAWRTIHIGLTPEELVILEESQQGVQIMLGRKQIHGICGMDVHPLPRLRS